MLETAAMNNRHFSRVSPLRDVAVQGRFGASKGDPGVTFGIRHPLSIVTVIARAGQGQATAAVLTGYTAQWAGPDQYFVLAEGLGEGTLYRELKSKLSGLASVSDQSHGRVVIRVAGPKVRAILAKGTPVDLHPDQFPLGKSAVTQMAHVGVHLTRVADDVFDLSVFRGFSESFWEWITEQAEEFGYQVV
jgi:heterotetrameric sarcosine oxidase gamma subunit